MAIHADILADDTPLAVVSIHPITPIAPQDPPTYGYHVMRPHHLTYRGHLTHTGPQDLTLLAAALCDYTLRHAPHTPHPPIEDL